MKLTNHEWFRAGRWMGKLSIAMGVLGMAAGSAAHGQTVTTTTVQGTVYLANGQPGSGTLALSWPSFTTASGQLVAADSMTVSIAPDGFLSVNLAPNQGATPAGQYYTAVYYLSDGTTNTQYWVVPAASQATLAQVQAQLMPAAQAVQTVSKAYVDQAITQSEGSLLSASGGTMTGPLTLCCDPTQPLQAADKHYVDETSALAVPLAGGNMTGALTTPAVNGVEYPVAGSSQTTLAAAMSAAGTNGAMEIPPTYAGTDGFTNPNGVYVADLRPGSSQQFERSVKEFGAVCDGSTDDTNALQSAIDYAETHGVALTIPEGTCKTRTLTWHGESIGGMGKQVSALMGFPGRDVLMTMPDAVNLLPYTRIHDLTIYVDQSLDASCSPAKGVVPAGACAANRPMENNSVFSPGGNGLSGTAGTGAGWAVGNCAIAMPAATGASGNGLQVAEIENLEIVATGVDPLAAQYPGAHSTHTCGLYLAQWPQWSEFRNIDIRGLNTGIAIPALPVTTPAGLNADSNRWQNITIQATHGFTAEAGSNNVLDNVVAMVGNSAATAEPPTGVVLNFAGTQQGWTVRNAVVLPAWNAVQPALTVTASGGAVTAVTVGSQAGVGFDPYGPQVPLSFSGSCTAQATASVTSSGAIGTVTVTQGGTGCSATTTGSVNVAGTWDTSAPVNLISGQGMTFYGGNFLKGNGGYTVWNAASSGSYGTQLGGGGGNLAGGGSYAALVTNSPLGSAYQADQFPGADFGAKLQSCLSALSASNGGTCDARNFTGTLSMGSDLTISTANATVLLPCATISTAKQILVTAGTRNVSLRGCALRGASTASGSQGGTVFLYSGSKAMVQVGDPTYAADTPGFHLDDAAINTTTATSAAAQGFTAYRTQELYLESLYFLGNSNQTGMTLDGTGNYTGGTFLDDEISGFQTAVNAIGHQAANSATTDWMNASAFVRLHIDCPTSGGNPISGTYGINLQQGDGNTFTGGDVEGCSTALHLGANAQNNTIVGLRNENSTNQVVADAGSAYNNWMTGGTMFTGQLTDNGTRNSFLDTFHRSFNGLNGDWYGSQKDATLTNHLRLGIGAGNERGLLNEIQTDYGYRWLEGYTDATAGEQFYQVEDLLNNVNRLSIGQYNNGQSSTNSQSVLNAAGTGAVVLNGSNNSGTGGVVIGSGGASETTVATINNAGNAQFNGTLQVGGSSTFTGSTTVKNQADAEIDASLQAGLTASQKESLIYKDWNGNSQWYAEKDASNNWMLNSATGGLDSFKAYQSTNSGDTYINASNSSGVVRVNYETGSGTGFKIYGGNSSSLYASLTGTTTIQFPGLASSNGYSCLQIDTTGYISNTGANCGTGSTNGTIQTGTSSALAYYAGNGTVLSPLTPGQAWSSLFSSTGVNPSCALLTTNGSGALGCSSYTPSGALTALGGQPAFTLTTTGSSGAATFAGNVLNIPQYNGASGTITAVTGTSPVISSGGAAPAISLAYMPVNKAGDTMSGALVNPSGFVGPLTGTVTGGASLDLPLGGGTMGGAISFTGSGAAAATMSNLGIAQVSVLDAGAVCDGTTDDSAAINALTLAWQNKQVEIDFPPGRTCAISTSILTYSGQGLKGPAAATEDINEAFTPSRILALSGFSGTSLIELVGTSTVGAYDYNSGIIDGLFFDQGSNSGLAAIQPQASTSTQVLDSTFQHIRCKTAYCLYLNTYDQSDTFRDVVSLGNGPTEQVLYLDGNANVGENIHVEGGGGTNAAVPYIYISGSQNTFNNTIVEGQCGTNKTDLSIYDANQITFDYYHDECAAGYVAATAVSITGSSRVKFGNLTIADPTEKINIATSDAVRIDNLYAVTAGGVSSLLSAMLTIDTGSFLSIGRYGNNYGDALEWLDLFPNVQVDAQWTAHSNTGVWAQTNRAQPNGENLLVNGSFNSGMYGWTNAQSEPITATPSPVSGDSGIELNFTGESFSSDTVSQPLVVTSAMVGHTFSFSALAEITNSASSTLPIMCPYFSGAGVSYAQWTNCASAGEGWTRIAGSFVPTAAGTMSIGFNVQGNGASTGNTIAYLADAVLVDGAVPGRFGGRFGSLKLNTQAIHSGSAAPTTGIWNVGDIVLNSAPGVGSNQGWVNTTAGSPGTWTPFGNVGPVTSVNGVAYPSSYSQYALVTAPTPASTGSLLPSAWTAGHTYLPAWQPSSTNPVAPAAIDANTLAVNSAGTAANLAGTVVDSAPYQSASGTTNYVAAPTTNAHTFVYAWQPSGGAAAPIAFDITNYLTTGTVTSVSGDGTVTNGTITTSGSLGLVNAAQNSVLAGPASGGAGAPSYQTAPTIAVTNMTGTGAFSTTGSAGSATKATNIAGGTAYALPYQSAANATAFLAGSTSSTKCFVQETGTGSAAQAPACSALVSGDIPNNAANTSGNAVTATTATNFSGSLAGDVTGTQSATSVVKVNGASVPVSKTVVGTNSGGQIVDASSATLANNTTGNAATATSLSTTGSNAQYWGVSGGTQGWYTPATGAVGASTPAWMKYLGNGSNGSCVVGTSCLSSSSSSLVESNQNYFFTTFTIPHGTSFTFQQGGAHIYATGACTIAGTLNLSGTSGSQASVAAAIGGGAGGGSGGGTAAGTSASSTSFNQGYQFGTAGTGGTNGAATGGNGANGTTASSNTQITLENSGNGDDCYECGGMPGKQGGSSGGAAGLEGGGVVLRCASITGTDGTYTGTIDVSGGPGSPTSTASEGAGSGGGAGLAFLWSQAAVSTWPNIYSAPGAGALGSAVLTTPTLSSITATSGGSCTASTTLYYEVSAIEGPLVTSTNTISSITGYSTLSGEQSCATSSSNKQCPLSWTQIPGATGYIYWRGTSSGAETYAGTVSSGYTLTATDTCSLSSGGTAASGYATTNTSSWATVPQALTSSGTCTSPAKVLLGVTSNALSSCTVIQPGAGCGTGAGVVFNILGGGGSGGTITPTWSSGALASCTASGGSGYTAANYATSGSGGDGGAGYFAEWQTQ